MDVLTNIAECREALLAAKRAAEVGLVPTMGALHEGHFSLIRAARSRCQVVAVTIFVNPTQFAPGEDFERYPRPLEADLCGCRDAGVDIVFTPSVEAMYPKDCRTTVHVAGLTEGLCGPHRPGHFDGVATVVSKLFHILPADVAFFGEKDYQQLAVIRRMVRDLDVPMEIVGCPTVREPDGLAMSSRNAYLTPAQRLQARSLYEGLQQAHRAVQEGEIRADPVAARVRQVVARAGPSQIDYIEVVDPDDLRPLVRIDRPARICLAVHIGKTRLIDNIAVAPPPQRR